MDVSDKPYCSTCQSIICVGPSECEPLVHSLPAHRRYPSCVSQVAHLLNIILVDRVHSGCAIGVYVPHLPSCVVSASCAFMCLQALPALRDLMEDRGTLHMEATRLQQEINYAATATKCGDCMQTKGTDVHACRPMGPCVAWSCCLSRL